MYSNIIVAFEAEENRRRIVDMLESGGIHVGNTCRSGAEVIRIVNKIGGGLVVCGFKLKDMTAADLADNLSGIATLLTIASPMRMQLCDKENVFKLPTPITKSDLMASVRMMSQVEQKYYKTALPGRDPEEEKLIKMAKELLMDRNLMTEEEAHRFIQKRSMNTGSKMVETARVIINTGEQTASMPDFGLQRKE